MTNRNRKNSLHRKSRHLFIGFLTCFSSLHVKGNEDVPNEQQAGKHFSWVEHRKLSWGDFKGHVNAYSDESAAATCCSIGFRVCNDTTGNPEINVYNTFYVDRSWVKDDAKIESILVHEQGHFDLCELYTRKLRAQLGTIDLNSLNAKQELMKIYSAISDEYETRQQAYEQETTHGTNIAEQRRWQAIISNELGQFS